ncbi:hypothetical protein ACFYU8_18470 [Brevibacillus sp. NPDC003359]|uniref:hypothetical protein n=1 Tax=unclassified Brevibacillus TaxID=2684853 RepID=UPI0036B94B72
MTFSMNLSSWQLILLILIFFIAFCFWQYRKSQEAEADSRNYGRKRIITEVHNHYYGHDNETIQLMKQQNLNAPLAIGNTPVILDANEKNDEIKQMDMETKTTHEVSIDVSDLEELPQEKGNIVKMPLRSTINSELIDIKNEKNSTNYLNPFRTGKTSTPEVLISSEKNDMPAASNVEEVKVVHIEVPETTPIPENVRKVDVEGDPNINSLFETLVSVETGKTNNNDFWGIPFDQINMYLQFSEILDEPNKYVGGAFPIIGKVLEKKIFNDYCVLHLADPKIKRWVKVCDTVYREVDCEAIVALHEVEISMYEGNIVFEQKKNKDYYVFKLGKDQLIQAM